jgi:hypothetical protein
VWKPDFVTTVTNEKKKKINWGKLISLSFVLGILAAIALYLSTTKNAPKNADPVKMAFEGPIANSY